MDAKEGLAMTPFVPRKESLFCCKTLCFSLFLCHNKAVVIVFLCLCVLFLATIVQIRTPDEPISTLVILVSTTRQQQDRCNPTAASHPV